jgi:molecular chaperone IbpA
MTVLAKYHTGNIEKFLNDIDRYTIGMDDWIRKFESEISNIDSNYPPYNTIKVNETDYELEVALSGFKKDNISVYTESGKLFVIGKKEDDNIKNYVHRGLATRDFTRIWNLPDDLEIKKVSFEDGLLTIKLSKIIPDSQKKRVWF